MRLNVVFFARKSLSNLILIAQSRLIVLERVTVRAHAAFRWGNQRSEQVTFTVFRDLMPVIVCDNLLNIQKNLIKLVIIFVLVIVLLLTLFCVKNILPTKISRLTLYVTEH
jgi:hypothetical protein